MRRWLDFGGCDNFRDLGGYETRDGRTTRWGVAFRSDALGRSSAPPDLALKTVIDLRTEGEVAELPAPAWLDEIGARRLAIPMANPDLEALRRSGADGMGDLYLWNLDVKREAFAAIVEILSQESALPCVIHCNGGKDRTGIVVALILDLLGVPDTTIIEDYALSDEVVARAPAERRDQAIAGLVAAGLDPEILRTRPSTMVRFLDGFRDRWGSAEEYASVDADCVQAFRSALLEPGLVHSA